MKNNITELVFILDCSGSMCGLEKDTIGGFNSLIEKQKKADGQCYVSTILFNNHKKLLHDRVLLDNVNLMTAQDYVVGGNTALLDAMGWTIRHISDIHKYIRPEDVPEHTIIVITTDGEENSSRYYDINKVKQLVEEKKAENGWEFLFLGANIDAIKTAAGFGIAADRAVNYRADSQGTDTVFKALDETVACARLGVKIPETWSKDIESDYNERKFK